MKTKGLSLNFG